MKNTLLILSLLFIGLTLTEPSLGQPYSSTADVAPSKSRVKKDVHYNGYLIYDENGNEVTTGGGISEMGMPNEEIMRKYYCKVKSNYRSPKYEQAMKDYGATVLGYLSNNTYLVEANQATYQALVNTGMVEMTLFQNHHKVHNTFGVSPDFSAPGSAIMHPMMIVCKREGSLSAVKLMLQNMGIIVEKAYEQQDYYVIEAKGSERQISIIQSRDEIIKVELNPRPRLYNDKSAKIIGATMAKNSLGLTGAGQIIGVCDSGIDDTHPDFEGRISGIKAFSNDGHRDFSGHGTHVAGSVLGNGTASNGRFAGTAPKASLYFQEIQECPPLTSEVFTRYSCLLSGIPWKYSMLFDDAYDKGARIHSNSWGGDVCTCLEGDICKCVETVYNAKTHEIDAYAWDKQDMTLLFAAGNIGEIFDDKSISIQACAKNVLSVGAAKADSQKAPFSSYGPVPTNRIKPDVIAPGVDITSTYSSGELNREFKPNPDHPNYATVSGTSMATPLTAGAAALVREYFQKEERLSYIPATLIRATIVNGAVPLSNVPLDDASTLRGSELELTNTTAAGDAEIRLANTTKATLIDFPENTIGWGLVNIDNSLRPANAQMSYYVSPKGEGLKNTGEYEDFTFSIENRNMPLSITMVYHDPPDPLIEGSIVNHLRMQLLDPKGNTLLPNGLESDPMDVQNNVQRIRINFPEKGDYTLRILGKYIDTKFGAQPYAVVMGGTARLQKSNSEPSYMASFGVDVNEAKATVSYRPSIFPTIGIDTWEWNFGDGTIISSKDDPSNAFRETAPQAGVHQYKTYGEFNILLSVNWVNGKKVFHEQRVSIPKSIGGGKPTNPTDPPVKPTDPPVNPPKPPKPGDNKVKPAATIISTTACRKVALDFNINKTVEIKEIDWQVNRRKKSSNQAFQYDFKKNGKYVIDLELELSDGTKIKDRKVFNIKCNKCKYKREMRRKARKNK